MRYCVLAVALASAAGDDCRKFCLDDGKDWTVKCAWSKCAGCGACASLAIGNCRPSCATNTKGWDKKCGWSDCGGCSECTATPPPPAPAPGKCKASCATNTKGWDKKCGWSECEGCLACTSPSAPPPPPSPPPKLCSTVISSNALIKCYDSALFVGFTADEAACRSKCEAMPSCNVYAVWTTNWCRLTETCNSLLPIDTDGDGTPDFEDDDPVSPPVDVVQCASAPAPSPPPAPPPAPPPPPALPPKHCNTVVLEGGLDMCFGTPLFKGFVSDEAACALLCEAHALCHFYSAFSTGWCRLTASCGLAEVDSDGDGIPDSSDPDSTVDWVNVKSCGAPPSAPMPPLAPLL